MSNLKEKLGEQKYSQLLELLKDSGIEEKNIGIVDGMIPRARLNEVSDKLKLTEEKMSTYEKQLEETKKMLDSSEDYKAKYSELENKYIEDLKNKDVEINSIYTKTKIKEHLVNEGCIHPELLMKEINMENIKLDGEKLFGFDEQFNKLKEVYSETLFKQVEQRQENSTTASSNNTSQNFDKETGIDLSFMDEL